MSRTSIEAKVATASMYVAFVLALGYGLQALLPSLWRSRVASGAEQHGAALEHIDAFRARAEAVLYVTVRRTEGPGVATLPVAGARVSLFDAEACRLGVDEYVRFDIEPDAAVECRATTDELGCCRLVARGFGRKVLFVDGESIAPIVRHGLWLRKHEHPPRVRVETGPPRVALRVRNDTAKPVSFWPSYASWVPPAPLRAPPGTEIGVPCVLPDEAPQYVIAQCMSTGRVWTAYPTEGRSRRKDSSLAWCISASPCRHDAVVGNGVVLSSRVIQECLGWPSGALRLKSQWPYQALEIALGRLTATVETDADGNALVETWLHDAPVLVRSIESAGRTGPYVAVAMVPTGTQTPSAWVPPCDGPSTNPPGDEVRDLVGVVRDWPWDADAELVYQSLKAGGRTVLRTSVVSSLGGFALRDVPSGLDGDIILTMKWPGIRIQKVWSARAVPKTVNRRGVALTSLSIGNAQLELPVPDVPIMSISGSVGTCMFSLDRPVCLAFKGRSIFIRRLDVGPVDVQIVTELGAVQAWSGLSTAL